MTRPTTALCIDARGVAVLLGISLRTVQRMNDAGKLPEPVAFGALKRWRIEELEAWLRAGCPPRKSWAWSEAS